MLTNKYAEGYPGKRYYGGCEYVDVVENLAIERAKQLFGAEHANVQPHSGAQANMAVYFAVLQAGRHDPGHGPRPRRPPDPRHAAEFLRQALQRRAPTACDRTTERIDYDALAGCATRAQAEDDRRRRQRLSARSSTSTRFREIADEVGALLMVDMAHIAGLVAAGLHPSPVPARRFRHHHHAQDPARPARRHDPVQSASTPRRSIKRVFPACRAARSCTSSPPRPCAFGEALQPEFKDYQQQIVANAKRLAAGLASGGFRLVSGGTDNHLMLVDVQPPRPHRQGRRSRRSTKPASPSTRTPSPSTRSPPLEASGIRIGTPALTTRGMREPEMDVIARLIGNVLRAPADEAIKEQVRSEVAELVSRFPVPGID